MPTLLGGWPPSPRRLPDGRPGRDDDPAAQSARGGAGPEPAGEFVLLLGRSGSTACPMDAETCPARASAAPRDGQAGGCARWARGAVPGEQPRLAGPVGLALHPSVCPQETLVLLLKSLPLGCYFNMYGFGSEFESFYPCSCLRMGR
ncbi:unnamed protein product [Eretmochelys imbricata]